LLYWWTKHKLTGLLAYYRIKRDTIVKSIGALAAANANVVIILYGQLTRKQSNIAQKKNTLRIEHLRNAVSWLAENNLQWQSFRLNVNDIIKSFQNPSVIEQCQVVDNNDLDLKETKHLMYTIQRANLTLTMEAKKVEKHYKK
jgi:hypothetical protein